MTLLRKLRCWWRGWHDFVEVDRFDVYGTTYSSLRCRCGARTRICHRDDWTEETVREVISMRPTEGA